MKVLQTTLLIVVKDDRILLARKKRGFGAGKINGVGGKLEPNETVEQAMIRETKEEIGITPKLYKKMAVIEFDEVMKGERLLNVMNVYIANEFEGSPTESDEMSPEWFNLDEIPYDKMFPDDKFWLPEILKGNMVKGKFYFDDDYNIVSKDLKIVNTIE